MFRAEHSGVSNPSLFLSFRGVRLGKATFVVGLPSFGIHITVVKAFGFSLNVSLTTLYAVPINLGLPV